MAELRPAQFGQLVARMIREHEGEGKIFDLPERKFWRGSADLDTSVLLHSHAASNPLGPAAGPQDQMAQNIVLSWLAGSRILELKTVQINDRLTIPRPCIDATNVGYNVEWSQELLLGESLREYVAGSMLIDILRHLGIPGGGRDETIFDMSVGYDLKGVRSDPVRSWIGAMKGARAVVDSLRGEIPRAHAPLRDLDFRTALSDEITLSTFHGCPAGEIEGIVTFLLVEMGVHVTVKLNPTLLGRPRVDHLLHDVLGFTEIETRPEDFEKDLQWDQALEMSDRLSALARSLGRTFRVKFSNTLVVRNHRSFFPPSEAVMYLSGAPLHVITLNLVESFRKERPEIPISFSAGVDNQNFPSCVALGFTPITTCTDLLRPGGYARLPRYLENLEERMRALGVSSVGDFVVKALGRGPEAIRAAVGRGSLEDSLLAELASARVDLRGVLDRAGQGALYAGLVHRAALLNTAPVVAAATADPRYRAAALRGVPRKIGSHLALFDCINCDKCVPVCPNDANFTYETGPLALPYSNFRVEKGECASVPGGVFEVRRAHQIATFQDFCNDCGNCDTFCPEDGGPYVEKPRFFGSLEAFRRVGRDGFFVRRTGGKDEAWGRIRGQEYRLEIERPIDRALFTDGLVSVEVRHSERRAGSARPNPGAAEGHLLDFSCYLTLALVVDGVLDTRRANPVNAALLAGEGSP